MKNPSKSIRGYTSNLSNGLEKLNLDSNCTQPVELTDLQIATILEALPPKANQRRRFVEYLARNPLSKTKDCCRAIACVNLSHIRRVTADELAKFGLEAKCIHPSEPIKNGFGESTGQVLWALYELGGDK